MNPQETYQGLLTNYQSKFQAINSQLRWISVARLLSFILIVLAAIYLWEYGESVVIPAEIILFAVFLTLIKKYIAKEKERAFYQNLIDINNDEIKALTGDFSHFNNGNEFTDIHHSYSYDLDIFGEQSFFQFLNRTATQLGKEKLAALLNRCETDSDIIKNKQIAIAELANELNWRQHFAAKGRSKNDKNDSDIISNWSSTSFKLKNEKSISITIIILPILTVASILLNILGIIPWGAVLLLLLAQWIIYGASAKSIRRFHNQFGNHSKILSKYIEMLCDIEKANFQSAHLNEIKQQLFFQGKSASQISGKLMKLISELDYAQNLIMAIILNSVFLWDIRCIYKLSIWHQQYHHLLSKWFDVIAEFDVLSSFGNFNFNHPQWILPTPVTGQFVFEAEKLGHPLIDERKRVDNNFSLDGNGKLTIITGANMAGKSTFLRTIGINLVLAMNGCKVCAKQMQFTPIALYTNMRTTDNLMNDESYFYAELLRLQQLLERLRHDERLFVIIDEMLKGTNSVDKLNGSKELVKQLISLNAVGIVATHDLKLTELQAKFPDSIQNQCFEVQLTDDNLAFDYQLRNGVTQTMNATFLMKKMGIIN